MGASIKSIEIEDGVNGYVDLVNHVLIYGDRVAPRGLGTLEIEDAVVYIDNVFATLPVGVKRNPVAGIGAVEACQLLGGVAVPETVIAIGPQFKNYAEEDGKFHGSYGTRTSGQYDAVIEKLKNDNDSRQAVVTLWDPSKDNTPYKRDYPCTVMHQFRIRNGKLNMSVYMRSNDVWLGAAYDFFQFTRVQIAMASVLGIEPGQYAHHVGSLHIYETNFEAATQLQKTEIVTAPPPIVGSSWGNIKIMAQTALASVYSQRAYESLGDAELWYADSMIHAMYKNSKKNAT